MASDTTGPVTALVDGRIDPSVLAVLVKRPRLGAVLLALHEMTEHSRHCRISVDISDGVIRIFRESLVKSVPFATGPETGP